jgi:hypothetical protein
MIADCERLQRISDEARMKSEQARLALDWAHRAPQVLKALRPWRMARNFGRSSPTTSGRPVRTDPDPRYARAFECDGSRSDSAATYAPPCTGALRCGQGKRRSPRAGGISGLSCEARLAALDSGTRRARRDSLFPPRDGLAVQVRKPLDRGASEARIARQQWTHPARGRAGGTWDHIAAHVRDCERAGLACFTVGRRWGGARGLPSCISPIRASVSLQRSCAR